MAAFRDIGPPWGAIVFIHAHGQKLEEKISCNGVLLNQGNDMFCNYVFIVQAERIKQQLKASPNQSLEYYKNILKREKKYNIELFNKGSIKPPTMETVADRTMHELYLQSGEIIDDFSLNGCNDYLFDRSDPSLEAEKTHSIEFVYIDPRFKQNILGQNLFDLSKKMLKLSDIVDFYNDFKSKLPLCVISLACPYDADLDDRKSEELAAFEGARFKREERFERAKRPSEQTYHEQKKGRAEAPVAKPDEDDFDVDAFENLGGSKRKMNPKRKKKNPTRKKKSISRKSKKSTLGRILKK